MALVGAQPDWALGLTLIRQVLIRQVETVGPQDLNYIYYSLGLHVVLTYLVCGVYTSMHICRPLGKLRVVLLFKRIFLSLRGLQHHYHD